MPPETAAPKKGTIPRGTYDAAITGVAIVKRKDDDRYSLRVLVRTVRQGRDLVIWPGRPADTSDLLEGEATRLHALMDGGEVVPVKVWHNAKTGQQAAFVSSTSNGHTVGPIAGQVIMDVQAAADAAHAAHERVLRGLSAARLGLTVAAQGCHELQVSSGWRSLGFETLNEYLASPEVTLTRPEFFRLAAIWRAYVLEGGMEPTMLRGAAESKLEVPLPALGKGLVTVEQAVEDATSMPRADLRIHYARLVGGAEAEAEAERRESRRRDVEVTDDMVDRGCRAINGAWPPDADDDPRDLVQTVLHAALGRVA